MSISPDWPDYAYLEYYELKKENKMKFTSIEDAEKVIKEATEYIESKKITEDDIYSGAVFFTSYNDKVCIIESCYSSNLYYIGGLHNDPLNLYSDFKAPVRKEVILEKIKAYSWTKAPNIKVEFVEKKETESRD